MQNNSLNLRYTPKNKEKYAKNQIKLRESIKDPVLVRKIVQMIDEGKGQAEITAEIMKVYQRIRDKTMKDLLQ